MHHEQQLSESRQTMASSITICQSCDYTIHSESGPEAKAMAEKHHNRQCPSFITAQHTYPSSETYSGPSDNTPFQAEPAVVHQYTGCHFTTNNIVEGNGTSQEWDPSQECDPSQLTGNTPLLTFLQEITLEHYYQQFLEQDLTLEILLEYYAAGDLKNILKEIGVTFGNAARITKALDNRLQETGAQKENEKSMLVGNEELLKGGRVTLKEDEDAVIISDVTAAVKEAFKSGGEEGVRELTEKHLNRWKFQKVNFAVTGGTGVGKSTFINTLRGLKPTHEKAAETGVKETTIEPRSYDFPENPNIKVWDLPGIGTEKFPKDEYFKKIDEFLEQMEEGIKFDSFDAFINLSAGRFSETDHLIADRINALGKPLFYARTKVDFDIRNNEEDKDIHPDETLDTIRKDCENNLKRIQNKYLFLISAKLIHCEKYNYPGLYSKIIHNLSDLQKEAFLLSIKVGTEEMVREKVMILHERMGFLKSLTIAIFRPFVANLIKNEVMFQRQELGIDEESIQNLAQDIGRTQQEVMEIIDLSSGSTTWLGFFTYETRLASNPFKDWDYADLFGELSFNEASAIKKLELMRNQYKVKM